MYYIFILREFWRPATKSKNLQPVILAETQQRIAFKKSCNCRWFVLNQFFVTKLVLYFELWSKPIIAFCIFSCISIHLFFFGPEIAIHQTNENSCTRSYYQLFNTHCSSVETNVHGMGAEPLTFKASKSMTETTSIHLGCVAVQDVWIQKFY